MNPRRFLNDTEGASLAEFAVSLPVFLLLLFGFIQVGLMLWAQIGLQHGVEMAARCASVSDIVVTQITTPKIPTPCYSSNGKASANVSSIQSYAAANSIALNPPASTFHVNDGSVPCPGGNLVTASYPFTALVYLYSVTLKASACSPTTNP